MFAAHHIEPTPRIRCAFMIELQDDGIGSDIIHGNQLNAHCKDHTGAMQTKQYASTGHERDYKVN
jgi:hypothetical protein